ncbi:MAG: hypothetical protein HZA95_02955 [Candidatus Vogelbacteria bacterium]|nr:hypothetical protein [Candidatus Vogelbacteria bacterium]
MGNFNRDNRGGDRGGFRGGNRGFGGDRGGRGGFDKPTMHKATCADCEKTCEVPFRPTGDRPVYCSDCFGGHRDDAPSGGDRGARGGIFDRPRPTRDFNAPAPVRFDKNAELLEKIGVKLDKIISLLSGEKRGVEVASAVARAKEDVIEIVAKPKVSKKKLLPVKK